jgi:hypothetical protein
MVLSLWASMPQNLEKALDSKTTKILQGEVASDLSEYLVMFGLLFCEKRAFHLTNLE